MKKINENGFYCVQCLKYIFFQIIHQSENKSKQILSPFIISRVFILTMEKDDDPRVAS